MGGIRSTLQECKFIRNLFDNLALKTDERDIFMEKEHQAELDEKTGELNSPVPQVFVNGVWLGVSLLTTLIHFVHQLNPTSETAIMGYRAIRRCTVAMNSACLINLNSELKFIKIHVIFSPDFLPVPRHEMSNIFHCAAALVIKSRSFSLPFIFRL